MALFEDVFKGGNIITGLAVGIGAAVIVPVIGPVLRPLAKSTLKAGLVAYDQGRTMFSELAEKSSDMLAEAREEMAQEANGADSARPDTANAIGSASG